jgi:mono/diheme cytochrome c family protein
VVSGFNFVGISTPLNDHKILHQNMNRYFFIISSLLLISCAQENASTETSTKEISGAKIYNQWCVVCHGDKGNANIGGAKDLSISPLSSDEKKHIILNGSTNKLMRGFQNDLSEQELEALLQHVESLVTK